MPIFGFPKLYCCSIFGFLSISLCFSFLWIAFDFWVGCQMQKQSILKRDQSLIKPFNKNKLLTIFQRGNPQDVQMFNNVNEKGVVNNIKKILLGFGMVPSISFCFSSLWIAFLFWVNCQMQKQSILKRDQSLIKPFDKNKLLTIFQRGNPQDVQMFNNVNEKGWWII